MSQQSQVEAHLLEGWYLTPAKALDLFGCFRLASIIERMRKRGINVITKLSGETRYAIYYISLKERNRYNSQLRKTKKQAKVAA